MIERASTVLRHHKVKTADDYLTFATRQIQKLRATGYTDLAIHDDHTPKRARIDWGRWVIDCECGAGNAVDPEWPFAACPACGAVHRNILYPPNREAIEAALNARPNQRNRFWNPDETLDQLRTENLAHGLGVEP